MPLSFNHDENFWAITLSLYTEEKSVLPQVAINQAVQNEVLRRVLLLQYIDLITANIITEMKVRT